MEPETKICQNCKKDFTIETEDFNFYEKIKVPPPTWCPECRMIRRFSFQNAWNLNWYICDKCGEKTLSIFTPGQKMPVYCQTCWWGDDWDGTEFAMNYDPHKPFLEQLKELSEKTPHVAVSAEYSTNKNSEYSNNIAWSKDCYLVIWADYCENVYFSSILFKLKYSADCLLARESELCYESIGINKCYRTFFSLDCDNCVDVWFSRNCYGCTSCIGCVNLRDASNCIFNVKYNKEEYERRLKILSLNSRKGINYLVEEASNFWLTKPYRIYSGNSLNKNVTGEYVYESKDSKELYICTGAENCKWTQFITVKPAKDCMDYSGWGNNAELIYESANVGEDVSSVKFSTYCFPNIENAEYCLWLISGKNDFGCVNLKRKSYCILNKEYSKEEYEKLRTQIIKDMSENPYTDELGKIWTYGEFFQPGFGKFAYNNSNAHKFFPKTKEEALKEGYTWNDYAEQQAKATISGNDLHETISEVDETILKEVISCTTCDRKYKIASLEFDLLRKMNMPLPARCLKCREKSRFNKLQMPKLYDRACMKCNKAIRTSYSPNRPEIVYCERCYQQEVY